MSGMPQVLFAEVPYFYAAVERADDPGLRGRPLIVGGDPRRRGQVQCASAEAVSAGVEVGMPVLEALERCPRARALRTDMRRYREMSVRLRSCLWSEVDALEPAGLAGAYVAAGADAERASRLAARLAERVGSELGLPLRVGLASAKFLARLAAEEVGAEGVRHIPPGGENEFLHRLPVDRLPGVGPNTAARLAALGAARVGDVVRLGPEVLERELGNHGLRILELALGRDGARVRAARHPQSLSQEHTFEAPQTDRVVLEEWLRRLAQDLEAGLQRQQLRARRVALKVRYADRTAESRSQTRPHPLTAASEIAACAVELLERTAVGSQPVRGLGLALSRLSRTRRDDRQLDLFSESG